MARPKGSKLTEEHKAKIREARARQKFEQPRSWESRRRSSEGAYRAHERKLMESFNKNMGTES